MKIVVTSDWHLDAVTAGVPRVDEFERYFRALLEEAAGCDLALVLGDYFDPGGLNQAEMTSRVMTAAYRLSQVCPMTVFVAGNHDVIESSEGWTTISPLRVAVEGDFGDGRLAVMETPTFSNVAGRVGLLALPYVATAAARTRRCEEALEYAFRRAAKSSLPLVVAGHLAVPGALMGSESAEMARGRDVDLPVDLLAELRPRLVVNGHYHRPQVVRGVVDTVIPGSPHRFTFDERDPTDRGFVVAEIQGA